MIPYTMPDPRNNGETLPLVLVEWVDAAGDNGWADFHAALGETPGPCFVVGFLIADTDTHITVVSMGYADIGHVADRTTIPKTWQVKIIPLGVVDGTV